MIKKKSAAPLGVLDSGVGGLSVVIELRKLLPHEDILYFADSGNCPYGLRPPAEIRELVYNTAEFLIGQGAKAIVVACNTASTAAIVNLRQSWPAIPFIGMVPAVKPAVAYTKSGKIGVLATAATGSAPALREVIDRFAEGLEVTIIAPPGLVEAVESGQVATPATETLLSQALAPLLASGVDTLVLGCTHFPFLRPTLEKIGDGRLQLIDSGEAVARQTHRVLTEAGLLTTQTSVGKLVCYTSGNPSALSAVIAQLLGKSALSAPIRYAGLASPKPSPA